jgi:hypothetical protein
VERSARFVAVLLLRHGGTVADEFSENRDRLFAGIIEPINTYAVIVVGVFRDLEYIGRSAVVKFHGQRIRREHVVGDVAAPLSSDVFICHCVRGVCRTDRRQNYNRYQPKVFHGTTLSLLESPQALYVKRDAARAGRTRRSRGLVRLRTAVNRPTKVVVWIDCLALALFGLPAVHRAETQRRARPARALDSPRGRHYHASHEPT